MLYTDKNHTTLKTVIGGDKITECCLRKAFRDAESPGATGVMFCSNCGKIVVDKISESSEEDSS